MAASLSRRRQLGTVVAEKPSLAGNARKSLGAGLQISVPVKLHGMSGMKVRVRKHPYVITLRWNHQPAMVCVDMEKRS